MLTAMVKFQRLSNLTGQMYTILTNDQQLYRIVVNVTWTYPAQFQNCISRLGGMHTLVNMAGAVGVLVSDTGLETIHQAAFGGVLTILSGKKLPQTIRTLRHLTEELLREVIYKMESFAGLMAGTQDKDESHSKLWVENLIKSVMTMMMFVRAEREADRPLNLWSVKEMMP